MLINKYIIALFVFINLSVTSVYAMDVHSSKEKETRTSITAFLPAELWLLIADNVPADNRFLNELARQVYLSQAIYKKIARAVLSRASIDDSLDTLIRKYFITARFQVCMGEGDAKKTISFAQFMRLMMLSVLEETGPYRIPKSIYEYDTLTTTLLTNERRCYTDSPDAFTLDLNSLTPEQTNALKSRLSSELLNLHKLKHAANRMLTTSAKASIDSFFYRYLPTHYNFFGRFFEWIELGLQHQTIPMFIKERSYYLPFSLHMIAQVACWYQGFFGHRQVGRIVWPTLIVANAICYNNYVQSRMWKNVAVTNDLTSAHGTRMGKILQMLQK